MVGNELKGISSAISFQKHTISDTFIGCRWPFLSAIPARCYTSSPLWVCFFLKYHSDFYKEGNEIPKTYFKLIISINNHKSSFENSPISHYFFFSFCENEKFLSFFSVMNVSSHEEYKLNDLARDLQIDNVGRLENYVTCKRTITVCGVNSGVSLYKFFF